jgi:hypothetical protein
MSPDTDRTMGPESAGIGLAHAISPAAAKYCRGQRQSGTGELAVRTLRQRRLRLIPAPA